MYLKAQSVLFCRFFLCAKSSKSYSDFYGSPFPPLMKKNYEILSQNYEILSHNYEMLSHNYEILSHNYEILSHNYEITKSKL